MLPQFQIKAVPKFNLDSLVFGKSIGKGEFSVVFQCKDEQTAKNYAVKKVKTNIIRKEDKRKLKINFQRGFNLDHKHLVPLHHIQISGLSCNVVMSHQIGYTVRQVVGRIPLPEESFLKFVK